MIALKKQKQLLSQEKIQQIIRHYLTELDEIDFHADCDLISDLASTYQSEYPDIDGLYDLCVSAALNPR